MDLIARCCALCKAIRDKSNAVKSNRRQFKYLNMRMEHIMGELERLQQQKHVPTSNVTLQAFYNFLEEVAQFVTQKRFQKQTQATPALKWLVDMYYSSDDQAQFIEFDRRISHYLQSLNLVITGQLLDLTSKLAGAAREDREEVNGNAHSLKLREVDMSKLKLDSSNTNNIIGAGTFSTVLIGQYYDEDVAIKQLRVAANHKTLIKEATVMQYANHRNILAIKGANLSKGIIVMELAVCSLSDYLYHADPTAEARARPLLAAAAVPTLQWRVDVIRDVSDAVRYLHANNILHRDIKSPNVLLFRDPSTGLTTAKLGDFGLALAVDLVSRTVGTALTTGLAAVQRAVGTYSYMAPELFNRERGKRIPYSEASDVYSLGVLVNEVMGGRTPWEVSAREADIQNWVTKGERPTRWDLTGIDATTANAASTFAECAQRLWHLVGTSDGLHCCWSQEPHHRCSAEDIYAAANVHPATTSTSAEGAQLERTPEVVLPATPPPAQTPEAERMEADADLHTNNVASTTSSNKSSRDKSYFDWLFPSSSLRSSTLNDHADVRDDLQDLEKFTLHFKQTFPDIPSDNVRRYAKKLFETSVRTVPRLLQLIQEKKKSNYVFESWATSLGVATFDAMDMREHSGTAEALNKDTSFETLDVLHGTDRLVEWLAQHVPDLPLLSEQRKVAELLHKAGVTCPARLAHRVRNIAWLVELGLETRNAKNIVIAAVAASLPTSSAKHPLFAGVDELGSAEKERKKVYAAFVSDLRSVVPDMSMEKAEQYCARLMDTGISTVDRLHSVAKDEGISFFKRLGWHDFDALDFLLLPPKQLKRTPLPAVDKLHGVEVLSLWLLDHVPNIALSGIRTSYCKALLQHNVSTVQRLARHGCSEAWLIRIGIDQLDAKDIAAVLRPMHQQDAVVTKQAREDQDEKLVAARKKYPARAWVGADTHRFICCKPWCEFLLEPDNIHMLLVPCSMCSYIARDIREELPQCSVSVCATIGFPVVYPFYCGLCSMRLMGLEVDTNIKAYEVAQGACLAACIGLLMLSGSAHK